MSINSEKAVLFLSPVNPFKLGEGGAIGVRTHLNFLIERFYVDIVYLENSSVEDSSSKFQNVRLYPIRIKEAAKPKMVSFIIKKLFKLLVRKNKGNEYSQFIIDDLSSKKFSSLYERLPVKVIDTVHRLIKANQYDFAEVHFIQWAGLRVLLPGSVKTVFVHHELRSYRYLSNIKIKENGNSADMEFDYYSYRLLLKQEKSLIEDFDKIICVSNYDCDFVIHTMGISASKVDFVFPCLLQTSKKSIPANVRDQIYFLGGSAHPPNREGLFWLLTEIKKSKKDWEQWLPIQIVGEWRKDYREFFSKEFGGRVKFTGFVDDLEAYSSNKIMICPIRVVSGVRMKLLEAMTNGVPIFTTEMGKLGTGLENSVSCIVFENIDEVLEKLNGTERQELDRLVQNASQNMVHFSEESFALKKNKIYHDLL